jgi:predicted RNase H-like nuclease (RuvC/YqgF family)
LTKIKEETMDRKSYETVLNDCNRDISEKRAAMDILQKEIEQIENTISFLQAKLQSEEDLDGEQIKTETITESQEANNHFNLSAANEYSRENQSKISLNNACEKILQNEGKSLYIADLIEKLKGYGRYTDRKQLHGTIRKDNKNRFVNLGGNVWDLASRHQQKNEKEN